jgi:hypothetical protein
MDLTPNTEHNRAALAGTPANAEVAAAGQWTAALWSDWARHPAAPRCVVDGPGAVGEAWLKLAPTTSTLQLTAVPGRIGSREVELRRNRPRLRRRRRVITVVGEDVAWELTVAEDGFLIRDVTTGRDIWRRTSDGRRWADDHLDADSVAALLLWDWVGLERRLGPGVLL